MNNLFNAQVCFNGENPHLFKVRYDVMLKDLNDQPNEINLGDTLKKYIFVPKKCKLN